MPMEFTEHEIDTIREVLDDYLSLYDTDGPAADLAESPTMQALLTASYNLRRRIAEEAGEIDPV